MLYVKTKLNDQFEIKVELYEDEIITNCGNCGKELPVEPEEIAEIISNGCDFVGTTFYCEDCSKGVVTRDSSQS
jgi:hypothetical protein